MPWHLLWRVIITCDEEFFHLHVFNLSVPWWRHQMETFSALLAICAGNSPVPGEFPAHRPVTRSFHVFFDLRLNKPLSKQSWGGWFEALSRSLWRHRNVYLRLWQWAQSIQYMPGIMHDYIHMCVCICVYTYMYIACSRAPFSYPYAEGDQVR